MNLIFDVSNIYHRAYSIVSNYEGFNIEDPKSQSILVRKFFIDVCSIINKFETEGVVNIYFAFDSEPWRKKVDRTYKANRSAKHPEFYRLLSECYNILDSKDYLNAVKIDQLEADDIICLINDLHFDERNLIVSNDRDLLQLVSDTTFVFTANGQNYKCYCRDIKNLKHHPSLITIAKNIDPQFVAFEKILLGDDGDNVSRILPRGMGIKKVEALYAKMPDFEDMPELLAKNNIVIPDDQFEKQCSLVVLDKEFMPEQSVESFNSIKTKMYSFEFKLSMKDLLSGTIYLTDKNG